MHPSSFERQAAAQACVDAQVALLDLIRKIEEADSMIGKMPPAYETFIDTPSYIAGETEEGRSHRMFKSAARTIQKYLEHWTERREYVGARNRFDVYGALSDSMNSPKTRHPDFDKTHEHQSRREEPITGSPSNQPRTRKSSLSRSRSGPNPCLRRKKSVTWDPTLDEKRGAQEPEIQSPHERCKSFIEDQNSYWSGISEAGVRDADVAKALNAIEFVLSSVRQWCLDLMDLRCDLDSGYDHVKEYSRLTEMLMSDVLEKLDGLYIESDDPGNRQTRQRLANENVELLHQMDLFMREFRMDAPDHPRKRDSRDPDTTPNSPDLPRDEHGFVYNRTHVSPNAFYLGKIQAWLTKEELAVGGRRNVYFEAEIQNPITGAPRHAMLKMPIYIEPGSKPGTKIDVGHAWCQDSRSRTPDGYWTVVLMLDEDEQDAEDRRRGSSGRTPEEDIRRGRSSRRSRNEHYHQPMYYHGFVDKRMYPFHRGGPIVPEDVDHDGAFVITGNDLWKCTRGKTSSRLSKGPRWR
jgi:hypothetical protein